MSLVPPDSATESASASAQIRFDDRGRAELHALLDELISGEAFFDREGRVEAYRVLDARHLRGMSTR